MMTNCTHRGYMDGLAGRDPDPLLSSHIGGDYEAGYLSGCGDRESGVPYNSIFEAPQGAISALRRGMEFMVRKGTAIRSTGAVPTRQAARNYKVKIHSVSMGVPAYVDWQGAFIRPTPPSVSWAGSGKYWSECDLTVEDLSPSIESGSDATS